MLSTRAANPRETSRSGAPVSTAPSILVIGGPTAAGKTEVAFLAAQLLKTEIISADSRQFYREISVGTDKVSAERRAAVPHHLVDVCSLADDFTVADFCRRAFPLVRRILASGRTPVIIGGSGLYLRGLVRGIFALPPDDGRLASVRGALEALTTAELAARLRAADPDAAARIHPNDRRRLRRALEVFRATGIPITRWQGTRQRTLAELAPVRFTVLTRPRPDLHERIAVRVDAMLAAGWEEEVRAIAGAGLAARLRRKAPIGYREILDTLEGGEPRETLRARIIAATRGLARRQETWFRREPASWIMLRAGAEEAVAAGLAGSVQPTGA